MDKREFFRSLMGVFVEELHERVQALNQDLLALEHQPPPDRRAELLRTLFRSLHSLKGAARSVNADAIESACHGLEDLLTAIREGRLAFDAMRANRGEFHAFFLLSLIGVNLVCSASDLIWLFLALELTSLPTYIMVAISRPSRRAQEAAVKYFFLGAMATALFLYGFALLYGSTGTMVLTEIQARFAEQGGSPRPGSPDDFRAWLGENIKSYGAVIHEAGIKIGG